MGNLNVPNSNAVRPDNHKAEGQIDVALDPANARQAVPTTEPDKVFQFGLDGTVPDPKQGGQVPEPFGGVSGEAVDFGSVAPDTMKPSAPYPTRFVTSVPD